MKKYLKMSEWIILYLLAYMAVTSLVEFVWAMCYFMFNSKGLLFKNADFAKLFMENIQQNVYVVVLIAAVCTLPFLYVICRGRRENIFSICKIKKLTLKQVVKVVAVVFCLACFSEGLVDILVNKVNLTNEVSNTLGNPEHLILTFISIVVAAPIIEEVLFRGLVLNELKKNMNVYLAIIIQGVLFGLYHMNLLQGIYASLLGIALGFINYYTGTILSSIIGHMLFNILGTLGINVLYHYFGFLKYPLMIIGLIVGVLLLINMLREKKKSLCSEVI